MLKLVSAASFVLDADEVESITMCFRKFFKKPEILVSKQKNGEICVLPANVDVHADLIGAMYAKNNNIELEARLASGEEMERVIICQNGTGKRIIEIIELTNGEIKIEPLIKGITQVTVDSKQFNTILDGYFNQE